MKLSFQNLFYILTFIFGLFAITMVARGILIPLSMSLLISFILFPMVKKIESWGVNKLISAFIPILMVFLIIGGGITFFSTQILMLSDQLNDFSGKIMNTFSDAIVYINDNLNFAADLNKEELILNGQDWLKESSGYLLQNTFSGTASFFTGLISITLFTFLILIYRKGLTDVFVSFGVESNKKNIFNMLKKIQSVGKKYIFGMFILIVTLGFANSLGLWIIGIDSPFLFGFLASILSIIPFVGTLIGAIIPILYAFMSTESLWIPLQLWLCFGEFKL